MKTIVKYFLLICIALNSFAQNAITGSKKWYIKPAFNWGFIIPHRLALGNVIKGWIPMTEINIVKPTDGSKLWHLENNKPEVGITVNCIGYRNPDILGQCIAVAPFAEIPLNEKEKKTRCYMRLAWGAAYLTKCFDAEVNHKNIAIGSHWNAFVGFRWNWQINLSERLRIEPGISATHVSNGRGKVPNLGLNTIALNLGVNYKLVNTAEDKPLKVDSNTVVPSKHDLIIWYSYGFNETGNPNGPKYSAHTLSANYYFNKRNTNKIGFGVDAYYEELYLHDFDDKGITPSNSEKYRYGVKFAYAYSIGRISLPLEWGYYVGPRISPEGLFFHRLGVRYTGKHGLVLQFGLKTHFGVAYHFDYGIGYRFSLGKKNVVKD